jgi:hypothetical protein
LVGSVAACLVAAVGCWLQTSVVGWLANLAVLGILMLLAMVYGRPGRHLLPRRFAWLFPACGLAGLLSVVRVGSLGWPHVSSTAMGLLVLIVILVVYVVVGLREPGSEGATEALAFPLMSGRWAVMVGGVRALNHHVHTPGQAAALDLIAVRPDGARAAGVCPERLEDYEAYGQDVVSPCNGVVVSVVDDHPDEPPGMGRHGASAGNQVRIDTGRSIVFLCHLRPGSVRVAEGDQVETGAPLGQVGNSGRSSEPHLHVHAERAGQGLRLRFTDLPRARLRPGLVVEVAAVGPPAGRSSSRP